ncbi:hypothetical protein [Novipirellula rosea]|uniref:EF-hand domain-containing protein n=1 Tax=Novipirellula rosea TaxID=1031540 RepID=A0ABP8MT15_9BACT
MKHSIGWPPGLWVLGIAMHCVFALHCVPAAAQAPEPKSPPDPSDLLSLVLIQSDLSDATQTMTICDADEDGFIDAAERKRLAWRDEHATFDLNHDGKLTHLEVAIYLANQRDSLGITQFDRNNSQVFIKRHDTNRNGQLDADEIADGWPPDPSQFDKDADGIITAIEIAEQFAYKRVLRRELGIEAVDNMSAIKVMKKFDKDGDQNLDAKESAAAGLPLDIRGHDDNGDGKLNNIELAILFSKHRRELGLSKSDGVKAKRIIAMADFNQDGKISQDEMRGDAFSADGDASSQYTRFDANSDGTVTLGEVQTYIASERKQLGFSDEHIANARRLLLRHDTDRSTFIEPAELSSGASVPGKLPASTMKAADENKDGRLSLQELAKHLAKQQ